MKNKNIYPPSTSIQTKNNIKHPSYYGGKDNPYEVIKVIEAWDLNFHLGNVIKYISRAGKKDPKETLTDLKKAQWYLARFIEDYEIAKIKKLDI